MKVAWGCGIVAALGLALCTAEAGEKAPPSPVQQQANAKLLQAAQEGNAASVTTALAEGAEVNCRGAKGLTPLLQVLSGPTGTTNGNRRDCVALLLKNGAEVNATDAQGRTPLIYAVQAGDLETVRLLVDAGAFITLRDRSHKTALLHAAEGGQRQILIYLGQTLKTQQKQSAW